VSGQRPQLVVLTPVRNEAWILPRFLEVTSQVADRIIVLDQNSTDGSVELCRQFPKVLLLRNNSAKYDEAERQQILIEAARREVPGPRILLALDADEIIAADARETNDWQKMFGAEPGTVLFIEKPTFLGGFDRVIRYPGGFPLGVVDSGAPHNPKLIHSVRVPVPADAPQIKLDQVKVLHYALLRPAAQAAKNRMYAAIENIAATRHLLARRRMYCDGKDYTADGPVEPTKAQWLAGWELAGIDMRTIADNPPFWQDFELLRFFSQYGTRRFWLDDIWTPRWESYREEARRCGCLDIPSNNIAAPPEILRWVMRLLDAGYGALRNLKS
jgi:hypothetical protein